MGGFVKPLALSGLVVLGACEFEPAGPSPLDRIDVLSGDMQSAAPGETLAERVVARLYREDGSEAIYQLWVQLPDGGSIDLGGSRGSGEGVTLETPAMGVANALWTLADQPGTQRMRFFAVWTNGDTIEAFATATAVQPE